MLTLLLAFLLQRTVSGNVIDVDGRPIAGATVALLEARQEVTTDATGAFSFPEVPDGEYTLVVRHIGYAPESRTVDARKAESLTITLRVHATRVEPVTVTATRRAEDTFESPMPMSVLTGERVHRDATISIAQSVSRLPGVRDVSTGRQIGKPMVRGLFGSRVLVTHDGSRLEDYSWSNEDGPSIDARLAERVEVVRGPASVLYGSDALSGVVNVIPEELPVAPAGASFIHASAEAYGGSNNVELGSFAKVEGARGRLGYRLAGTGRFAGSYHTPVGEVDHTGFLSANVDAAAAFRGTAHSAIVRVSHYGGEFKLLEANGPAVPSAQDEGPERKLLDDRIQVAGNHMLGGMRLETRAQFQRHSLIEVSDDCVPPPNQATCTPPPPGQEATAFDLLLNTATMDVLAHHQVGTRLSGTVGVSGMFQGNDSRGPIFLVPDATITSGAGFALEELSVGKVHLIGGGRLDTRSLAADANAQLQRGDDHRSWTEASGHGGVWVNPMPSLALVGTIGMGWRAPTIFDLYANGPHLAEARYEVGDPNLAAERALTTDVGVRWRTSRARAELSLFDNDVENFIFVQPTMQTWNTLQVFRHTQADARLRGGEVSAEVAVAGPLSLRAQHDWVRGERTADASPLPLMPPPRTVVGADLRSDRLSWARRASFGIDVEHSAEQTQRDPNDYPGDAYTLVNLEFEVERRVHGRDYRVDLDVRNAANESYRDFLSRYKQFALEPGRNIVVRLGTDLF